VRRREFITLLGGAAIAWPFAVRAQQADRVRRIGVLIGAVADNPDQQARVAAFQQGLQQLGWTDGSNLRIEHRWGAGNADDIRKYAAELAALAPDVILVTGVAVEQMLQATRTVPIVFAIVPDPVGSGLVDSLSRPGGNATGFMQFEYSLCAKWLELLKQIAPAVTRVAVLRDPAVTGGIGQFAVIQSVAPAVGVEVRGQPSRRRRDRARGHGLRALPEWRPNRDGERVDGGSWRPDRHACGPAQTARGLYQPRLSRRRRPDLLRGRFCRPVPSRGRLCRPHP
jgi:putative ABC transport system substrate-binding protein